MRKSMYVMAARFLDEVETSPDRFTGPSSWKFMNWLELEVRLPIVVATPATKTCGWDRVRHPSQPPHNHLTTTSRQHRDARASHCKFW